MIIQQDTRQKKQHHKAKEKWFEEHGIRVINSKLLVGDYMIPTGNISVDTKQNIGELYSNLIQQHARFRAECELSQELGIKLYILVENEDGINEIKDILKWKNPQYFRYLKMQRQGVKAKPPATNQQIMKMLLTMEKKYDVTFLFCRPYQSGRKVFELLGGTDEDINENRSAS